MPHQNKVSDPPLRGKMIEGELIFHVEMRWGERECGGTSLAVVMRPSHVSSVSLRLRPKIHHKLELYIAIKMIRQREQNM